VSGLGRPVRGHARRLVLALLNGPYTVGAWLGPRPEPELLRALAEVLELRDEWSLAPLVIQDGEGGLELDGWDYPPARRELVRRFASEVTS